MIHPNNYLPIAQRNEIVFRNVLRHLRENRETLTLGELIPTDLDSEGSLKEIYHNYSDGARYGLFTIADFVLPQSDTALITFEMMNGDDGKGAEFEYRVNPDKSVNFYQTVCVID